MANSTPRQHPSPGGACLVAKGEVSRVSIAAASNARPEALPTTLRIQVALRIEFTRVSRGLKRKQDRWTGSLPAAFAFCKADSLWMDDLGSPLLMFPERTTLTKRHNGGFLIGGRWKLKLYPELGVKPADEYLDHAAISPCVLVPRRYNCLRLALKWTLNVRITFLPRKIGFQWFLCLWDWLESPPTVPRAERLACHSSRRP